MEEQPNYFKYLPIGESSKRTELYVTTLGKATIPAGETHYPPPGHPNKYLCNWTRGRILADYQMVLITAGGGEYECAKYGHYKMNAGSFFFLRPGEWHRYRPDPKTGWTEYWVGMDGHYLRRLVQNGLLQIYCPISLPRLRPHFIQRHTELWEITEQQPGKNTHFTSAYLHLFLAEVQDCLETYLVSVNGRLNDDQSIENQLVYKAIQFICNNLESIDKVEEIASEFSVTTRTLDRYFNKVLGCSIHQEIRRQRLQRAKDLLGKTTLPVVQIANSLGYKGEAGLRNIFQHFEHCTPAAYRKKVREKSPG